MPADTEPTRDELIAMAYADGELSGEGRREFEVRMLREPDLGRLVAEHRALEILARHAAPPEPIDTEWRRLARDPIVRWTQALGWFACVAGAMGLAALGIVEIWAADMHPIPKALVLAAIAGLLLLLFVTVHARLSTLSYDPYRNVER